MTFRFRSCQRELAIEPPTRITPSAPPRPVTGIEIDWLFDSPSVRLTRWSCLEQQRSVTRERQQYWHVIGFPHGGSYMLHAKDDSALIDANTIAFFNPLSVYRTSHPNGCGDHGVGLIVAPGVVADAISDWDRKAEETGEVRFPELHVASSPHAYWIQSRIIASVDSGAPIDAFEIEEAALALVAEAVSSLYGRKTMRRPVRSSARRRRREGVLAARALLGRRYRENVELREVAAAAELSIFHLCRTFKQETGVSVHRYLHRLRLRSALGSLPDYRRDFTRLALDLGYSSHSHFTSAFRREFGMTPSSAAAQLSKSMVAPPSSPR